MIQVVTQENSSRFLYVIDVLLSGIGKQEYQIVQEDKLRSDIPVIVYEDFVPNYRCIHVKPHKLLGAPIQEGVLHNELTDWNGIPCFLKTNGTIPFDMFAASFWLLSRWEEYLSHSKDRHQRYPAASSYSFQNGFLDRPVINEWVDCLFREINTIWPNILTENRTFKHTLTIDVDAPFAYRHKSIVTQIGGIGKNILSGQMNLVKERLEVVKRALADPFDTYDDFKENSENSDVIYFFHVGEKTSYDPATPKPSVMMDVLQKVSSYADVGLHPSYFSHEIEDFAIEKKRLEGWAKQPITKSRFHFLKFDISRSIRKIQEVGIQEEYSMGYAEEIGFRAGTCSPFPFYDLEKEEESSIIIHPFASMDATFLQYNKASVNEAITSMKEIVDRVYAVKGSIVSIWHNHSFSISAGNPEWKKVLTEVMAYIHSK
jgi:hypothetical protein